MESQKLSITSWHTCLIQNSMEENFYFENEFAKDEEVKLIKGH